MATGISLAQRANMMDWVFGGVASPTRPSACFLGLKDADPGDTNGSGTEPTAGTGNYGRVTTTFNTTNYNASTTGSNPATVTNKVAFSFAASSAAWSSGATTLPFFILMDASTAGNFLCRGSVTPPTAVAALGITLSFAAGNMSFTNAFT